MPIVLWLGAMLLVAAVGFQLLYQLREIPHPKPRQRLAIFIPNELGGWAVKDEPLGATETANKATLSVLNLDDYVYRRYQQSEREFTIYAAYWAAGRMPTRLVASHTPDRCWTESGMRCVGMKFHQPYTMAGRLLVPAEYREFTSGNGGSKTYVAYWHLIEGEVYDYGERFNAIPSPWRWWKDTVIQAAYGSREQLFVRIASQTPLEPLWEDKDFQAVMTKVADLGLWEAAAH